MPKCIFFWRNIMQWRKLIENRIAVLFLASGVCSLLMSDHRTARAADWPHWRGPNYNGISSETGWSATWPEDGPKVAWKASLGAGFASMAVSNGRVYAMGNVNNNDILYCFDAATGREIWKRPYRCPLYAKQHEGGPCGTPTVDGDAIYTFSKDGDAIRFNAATGEIVWHKKLNKEFGFEHPEWYFSSSPLVVDNLIILNAGTAGVALNKANGSIAWQSGKGVCGYATGVPFTIADQKCVALAVSRELVGLDPATGKVIWQFPWRTSYDINAADPIISGDTLFMTSGYRKGCALLKINESNVTEIWQNKNMSNHVNSSLLWKGHIYGFNGQVGGRGELTCLDFETGQVKWSQSGMGTGSLMLADGKLIILGEKGKLVIAEASPAGFKELASAQILTGKCWTVPVLANGRIYARNADGLLVCVDVSNKG